MLVTCTNCKKEINIKPSRISRVNNNFCSRECRDEYRHKLNYQKMSVRVGEDFKKWLFEMYVVQLKPLSEISKILYGEDKNCKSSVNRWLKKLDIELRHEGEAIKTQWIDNEERRVKASEKTKETLLRKDVRAKIKVTMKTKEYREKSRKAKVGNLNPMYGITGETNPLWNPDRTHEQRILERKTFKDRRWRTDIFDRDKYICQICKYDKGGCLVAHHKNSYDTYPKDRYNVDNGITLCEDCHKNFHSIYGYGKNTEEQFIEWKQHLLR